MVEIYGYSIATIPAVCAIVYGVIEFLKNFSFLKNEKLRKFIPAMSALLGAVFATIAFFVCPEIVPASAWYSAALVGCASGLSAVGVNQIKKQSEERDGEENGS